MVTVYLPALNKQGKRVKQNINKRYEFFKVLNYAAACAATKPFMPNTAPRMNIRTPNTRPDVNSLYYALEKFIKTGYNKL